MKKILSLLMVLAMALAFAACSQTPAPEATVSPSAQPAQPSAQPSAEPAAGAYIPGTYEATAQGMHAPMVVEVTFTADRIESINVKSHEETVMIGEVAVDTIPGQIVEFQSLAVDNISSATVSSAAIKSAVSQCVQEAGGDLSALLSAPVDKPEPVDETHDYDVVVVGSGLAGLTAAVAAADNGASVALIEKEDIIGGTSVMAEGYLFSVGEGDADSLYGVFTERGKEAPTVEGFPQANMLRVLADNNTPALDLIRTAGVPLEFVSGVNSIAVTEDGSVNPEIRTGYRIIKALADDFEKKGGTIYTSTPGTALIAQDGAVTGIVSEGKLGKRTFNAKSVILACGDFANNKEMLAQYAPQHAACYTISAKGNTGDGMTMALEVGAVPYENQYVQGGPLIFNPNDIWRGSYSSPEFLRNSMLVSLQGERKIAETQGTRPIQYTYTNGDVPDGAWSIMDAKIAAGLEGLEGYLSATSDTSAIRAYKADTIAELASLTGMDVEVLQASVDRYNELCDKGEDADFGKDAELMQAITEAPFYALRGYAINRGTIGGVKVNEQCQVLNESGEPIAGLYGAGMFISRPFFGGTYHGGSALGVSTTTGYIAGSSAGASASK